MPAAQVATLDAAKIDAIFAAIDSSNRPGVAVAIAIDGVPVYRRGFGLANAELPVALSPAMRMRIGSTTKHFAALAYMLLCEDGLASPDDEIGKHLPELHEASRHVTMRQLMGHTSGLRDMFAITMLFHGTGRAVTDKQLLEYYATIDDVDFAPGSSWSYNNGGYMLLSLAIERITGAPLADVLRKRIFEPVGMRDTMLRAWDSDFVPNSATLHMVDANGRYTRDYMGMEISGAGGMVSTMDDMLVWMKHMEAPVVGSAATWAAMKAPHRLSNGSSTGYGLGLITCPYRGVETLAHSGGVMGGNSQMIRVPGAKLDISIAANRADLNAAMLANEIIDACVAGLEPLPAVPAEGAEPAAPATPPAVKTTYYLSPKTGRLIGLSGEGAARMLAVDGQAPLPMAPDADGVLQLPPFMAFIKQSAIPGDGSIRFHDFGNEDVLEQLEQQPEAKLEALAATYEAATIGITAIVAQADDGPRLTTTGRYGRSDYKLEPVTDRIWNAIVIGPFQALRHVVTFDADGQGLSITAGRMPNIRFRRID
jgi:D-aminopeptidase